MSGSVEIVVEVQQLDPEVDFFVAQGFRVESILPADDPATVVLSKGAAAIRLVRSSVDRPVRLRVAVAQQDEEMRSPGGSTVEFAGPDDRVVVPDAQPTLVVSRPDQTSWVTGRAGMRYRDLFPGRWGGRYVASHIHIADGGPVPDYVHHHRVRFQLIVVKAGWVEVVYEDQGPPFVLASGDAVLQPPTIRHRVVRSSADLEVIEIGCPAEHVTLADHDLDLPSPALRPEREFEGQRFARFTLDDATSGEWRLDGFRAYDTGFGVASGGIVGARIVEPQDGGSHTAVEQTAELSLLVVLAGAVVLEHDGIAEAPLDAGASVALPAGTSLRLLDPSADLRLLDVTTPA